MKQLIRMITPFIAMLFLAACGGSSDSIINEIVDDIVDNPTTSDPKFTSDILVGKTYTITDVGVVTIVTFSETEVTIEEDGVTFTLSYVIDEDGLLVIDGNDVHILISIDENGDLHVENEGLESVWALTVETSDPSLKFTSEMLVGKTYTITDTGVVTTVTFSETEISGEDDEGPFTLPYVIDEDGVLVIEGNDFHTLISIDENGDLHVRNDAVESIWVLITVTDPINTSCMPLDVATGFGDIVFDRNGDLLIADDGYAGNPDGKILLVDRETCELNTYATIENDTMLSVVDDSSRDRIYVGGDNGVYEIEPIDKNETKIIPTSYVNSIVVAPDGFGTYGGYLVYASSDEVYVYDPSGVDPALLIYHATSYISDLVFGEDGTLYAALNSGGKVVTVASDGTAEDFVTMPSTCDGLEVDNAGSLFVACSGNDKLYSVEITSKTISELGDVNFDDGYYPAGLAFDGHTTLIMKTGENPGAIEAFELD